MTPWWWIPVALVLGTWFGFALMAMLVSAGRADDRSEFVSGYNYRVNQEKRGLFASTTAPWTPTALGLPDDEIEVWVAVGSAFFVAYHEDGRWYHADDGTPLILDPQFWMHIPEVPERAVSA